MIAHVVPVTRLRRDTTWWSYKIPPRSTCVAGSLVIIPFRGRDCLGVVWETEEQDEKADQLISEVLTPIPLVKQPHRQLIEFLSDYGLCSLSTALYRWLPAGLRELPLSAQVRSLLRNHSVVQSNQHAILVPGYRSAFRLRLQKKFTGSFSELFNDTADITTWFKIAEGTITVAMGRERSLFAPWNNLKQITVVDPEDISYYHEQIPYLHLLEPVQQLQEYTRSTLQFKTYLPDSAAKLLWPEYGIGGPSLPPVQFHDLRRNPLLNPELTERIQNTLQSGKRVLILYNAHDRTALIERNSLKEKILIPGIETLKKRLAHQLGRDSLEDWVIIGTRSILQENHTNIGLTIALSLDPLLSQSACFANMLHGVADLAKLAAYKVPCIVQSKQADHPLVSALINGTVDRYLKDYIEGQKERGLPPFGHYIVASYPASEITEEIRAIHLHISKLAGEEWTVGFPFPASWRKKDYCHILLHSPSLRTRLPVKLREYLVQLPRPWKIQRNPWYLL